MSGCLPACTSVRGGGTVGRGVGIGVTNQLGAADAGERLLTARRAWTRNGARKVAMQRLHDRWASTTVRTFQRLAVT